MEFISSLQDETLNSACIPAVEDNIEEPYHLLCRQQAYTKRLEDIDRILVTKFWQFFFFFNDQENEQDNNV